jgi:hypothetical protein
VSSAPATPTTEQYRDALAAIVEAWARDYHCCPLAERGGARTVGDHSVDCPWARAVILLTPTKPPALTVLHG